MKNLPAFHDAAQALVEDAKRLESSCREARRGIEEYRARQLEVVVEWVRLLEQLINE